jgi:hypothetical protein
VQLLTGSALALAHGLAAGQAKTLGQPVAKRAQESVFPASPREADFSRPARESEAFSIEALLRRKGSRLVTDTLARAAELRLQICFTRLTHGSNGAAFETHYYRRDADWFAPASLVKLPLAALLLEQLEAAGIDWRTAKLTFPNMPACAERAMELRRPQAVARLIERALVLSDDSAYCALFDALGPQHIRERMQALMPGANVRIQARFGSCGPENSRVTGPVQITNAAGKTLLLTPQRPPFALLSAAEPIKIGRAWMQGAHRVEGAKDFTESNSAPLPALHALMLALMRPELVPAGQRFQLSAQARETIVRGMRLNPADSAQSNPDERKLSRTFFRLLAVGDGQWPADLTVHNKVGWAYGFLSDQAHLQRGAQQCWISCAMYLNSDGVLNDGAYDYERIGRPFMAQIGRLLLEAG